MLNNITTMINNFKQNKPIFIINEKNQSKTEWIFWGFQGLNIFIGIGILDEYKIPYLSEGMWPILIILLCFLGFFVLAVVNIVLPVKQIKSPRLDFTITLILLVICWGFGSYELFYRIKYVAPYSFSNYRDNFSIKENNFVYSDELDSTIGSLNGTYKGSIKFSNLKVGDVLIPTNVEGFGSISDYTVFKREGKQIPVGSSSRMWVYSSNYSISKVPFKVKLTIPKIMANKTISGKIPIEVEVPHSSGNNSYDLYHETGSIPIHLKLPPIPPSKPLNISTKFSTISLILLYLIGPFILGRFLTSLQVGWKRLL